MPRWTRPLLTAAAVTAAGFVVLGGAGVAAADPTPGYPGGYPGGYTGGGGATGGITTTNPKPGGPVSVTASCTSGAGATLTFDGTTIATAPVANGSAVLTGTVPATASGTHSVVATCDNGARYPFTVTVQSAGSSGALASTGAKVVTLSAGGLVLVVAGMGLVLVSRRRRGTVA